MKKNTKAQKAPQKKSPISKNTKTHKHIQHRVGYNADIIPLASSKHFVNKLAKVTKSGLKSWTIKHREFVTAVTGNIAFTPVGGNYIINPGNSALFPWLSPIAVKFEKYKIKRLSLHYEHFANATISGQIAGYIDYDGRDLAPANLTALLQNFKATPKAVYEDMKIDYCKEFEIAKEYLVSINTSVGGTFVPNESVGIIYMVTQDLAEDDTAIGNLFVDYEIELLIPQGTNVTTLQGDEEFTFGIPVNVTPAIRINRNPLMDAIVSAAKSTATDENVFTKGSDLVANYITGQFENRTQLASPLDAGEWILNSIESGIRVPTGYNSAVSPVVFGKPGDYLVEGSCAIDFASGVDRLLLIPVSIIDLVIGVGTAGYATSVYRGLISIFNNSILTWSFWVKVGGVYGGLLAVFPKLSSGTDAGYFGAPQLTYVLNSIKKVTASNPSLVALFSALSGVDTTATQKVIVDGKYYLGGAEYRSKRPQLFTSTPELEKSEMASDLDLKQCQIDTDTCFGKEPLKHNYLDKIVSVGGEYRYPTDTDYARRGEISTPSSSSTQTLSDPRSTPNTPKLR